jgi:hypothetical protein
MKVALPYMEDFQPVTTRTLSTKQQSSYSHEVLSILKLNAVWSGCVTPPDMLFCRHVFTNTYLWLNEETASERRKWLFSSKATYTVPAQTKTSTN